MGPQKKEGQNHRARPFFCQRSGVSPIIGNMMILTIMVASITGILYWGTPMIQSFEAEIQHRAAQGSFERISANLRDVIYEGAGVNRSVDVTVPSGNLYIEQDRLRWTVSYMVVTGGDDDVDVLFDGLLDCDNVFTVSAPLSSGGYPSYPPRFSFLNVTVEGWDRGTLLWRHVDSVPVTGGPFVIPNGLLPYGFRGTFHVVARNHTRVSLATTGLTDPLAIEEAIRGVPAIAECWVFDVDTITQSLPTAFNRFTIQMANGGIVSDYPRTPRAKEAPIQLENEYDGALFLYMMDITPSGLTSAGTGSYTLVMGLNQIYVRQTISPETGLSLRVRDVCLRLNTTFKQAWLDSLKMEYEQKKYNLQANIGTFTGWRPVIVSEDPYPDLEDAVVYQYYDPSRQTHAGTDIVLKIIHCDLNVKLSGG